MKEYKYTKLDNAKEINIQSNKKTIDAILLPER
jgi:hypothetical protein